MTVIEIVLLILGALIFAASFIIPDRASRKLYENAEGIGSAINDIDTREMVESMKEDIERQVRVAVDTSAEAAVEDAVLRSERNIERVTNEKMMAIDEYAQTVMQDINKNHKEVVFLYDMLDNKTTDIKNTVRKAESTKSDIEDAGKKVRSELEAIARRSAETVIANSERAREKKAATGQSSGDSAAQIKTAQEPLRRNEEPEIPERVAAGPKVNPAYYEKTAAQRAEEAELKDNSMKEKGVPRLGRAAAAAFAQAAALNAETTAEDKADGEVSRTEYEPAAVLTEEKDDVAQETGYDNEALSDLYAAANPENYSGYDSGVMNVQDDNLHFVEQAESEVGEEDDEPQKGDVIFSNNDDLQGLVISMHRKGIDEVEIAKRLSIGVGEVRLMIELYGK